MVFRVRGGKPLFGEVNISGSKNAALPVIFATLITRGVSRIEGVPLIGDTAVALDIIRTFGAQATFSDGVLTVNTEKLEYREIDSSLSGAIRASTYLLGSCLGRFSVCRICDFGGCNFSNRPIDMHIAACEAFGGRAERDTIVANPLHPATVRFEKPSVGATINALILAASTCGKSTVIGYAKEPHVLALCDFLISAGAKIEFYEDKITVVGGNLHGGTVKIIPDMIEAGTYLFAGIATGGEVTVRNVDPTHLEAFLTALDKIGAKIRLGRDYITVSKPTASRRAVILAEAYPGFPTDLQPLAVPALASCSGGRVSDNVWRSRYGYLKTLEAFGLRYSLSSKGALIQRSEFSCAKVSAPDLRGGMAALVAALCANGESEILQAEYILRGYEYPSEKLTALGADVSLSEI